MSETILDLQNVSKRFGSISALNGLNLMLAKGRVLALLGPNGAGKTTSIRMIFDLLRPDCGTIAVMGMDPRIGALKIRRRAGYAPERPKMIPWMTIRQLLSFVAPFYPSWDLNYAESLRKQFNLSESQKIKTLSRGEEAKLALILGLAHRPELLVLDDATSGIDPAARRDILESVIHHLHEEGTTILFATHLLDEVEGLADEAAFLMNGKICICRRMEALKNEVKKVIYWTDAPPPPLPAGVAILKERADGPRIERVIDGYQPLQWSSLRVPNQIEIHDLSLEEIYLAFHDGKAV